MAAPRSGTTFLPSEMSPNTQWELFRIARNVRHAASPQKRDPLLESSTVVVGEHRVQVDFVRHPRARCYRLMLRRNGTARVTVPHRGTLTEAKSFLEKNLAWLSHRLQKAAEQPAALRAYGDGLPVWFRGEAVTLHVDQATRSAKLGGFQFGLRPHGRSLAVQVETALWNLARRELPPLVAHQAALHGFTVQSISVRNQRTRWGSCSPRAGISLNWRLVQTPEFVRDYIILHELAHLRHLNHSKRYWAEVKRICPEYELAEAWLRQFGPKVIQG